MTIIQYSVSEFKARCTTLIRELELHPQRIEVTNRGRVVAVVLPPEREQPLDPGAWLGSLRGSVLAFDEPTSPAVSAEEWTAKTADTD